LALCLHQSVFAPPDPLDGDMLGPDLSAESGEA